MHNHADKTPESKSQTDPNAVSQKTNNGRPSFQFVDNRQEAIVQRKLQEMANKSAQAKQVSQMQAQANEHSTQQQPVIQKKENNTGLPDNLKTGIENLSGYSMDDVKVHRNSDKPATLQAHAYAQGTDIHLAPGQEKHLPHEAWHVVQQKQGRVKPTMQMKGNVNINNDAGLEREADVMGGKALGFKLNQSAIKQLSHDKSAKSVSQLRKIGLFGLEAEIGEPFIIGAKKGEDGEDLISDHGVSFEEYKLGTIGGNIDVTLDNEQIANNETWAYRRYAVEFVQRAIDVVVGDVSPLVKMEGDWRKTVDFWKANIGSRDLLKGVVTKDWYAINDKWKGGQFDDKTDNPGVDKKEEEPGKFDWRNENYLTYIDAKSDDPEVSMQLTAGTNLQGFLEVYALTLQVLLSGEMPNKGEIESEQWKTSRKDDYTKPDTKKYLSLLQILTLYIKNNANENQRYAKEYISVMSRTSLDQVYGMLNDPAKNLFKQAVSDYIFEKEGNTLLKAFKRGPSTRVFLKDSSKETDASDITIEQMLLSITKQKKGEEVGTLVNDEEAAPGDVFSQKGLAGISEINTEDEAMIRKYGLTAANEMKNGQAGIIFESRAAKAQPLSKMGDIFKSIAIVMQQIEILDRAAKKQVEDDAKPGLLSKLKFW